MAASALPAPTLGPKGVGVSAAVSLDTVFAALDKAISDLEDQIADRESQIEALESENLFDEDLIRDLRRKREKIEAYDQDDVDRIISGDRPIEKNRRMIELEQQIKRGLSWDEWAQINREYQAEAEKMRTDLLTAIEQAVS